MSASPVILWFRRDLRLSDHPALWAAAKAGLVIPLFIRDQSVDGLGAAAKWRLGEGLRDSAYRAALASAFANGWANFGVRVAVVPQFAVAVHDDTWVAGVALAVAAAGTASSLQFSGRVADSVGRRPMVLAGLATTAVTLGLMGFSESLWVLLGLSAVSGFGAGMVNPGQQATVADVIGNERSGGTVLSTFQMAQDGGAILGPVLIGVVADQAGFEAAFLVTGLVSLVALLPWLVARETLQKESPEQPADGPATR